MIHLSLRAWAWLCGDPAQSVQIATPACTMLGKNPPRPGNGRDWCRTEDARAVVRGWRQTYIKTTWGTEKRAITVPTCPDCCVLFDQAVDASKRFRENKEQRMRRGSDPKWVYLSNGDLAGIAMGSDCCSEHEWGVKPMRQYFGCVESNDGITRRQATLIPKDLKKFSGVAAHPSDKRKKGTPYDAIFLSPDYGRTAEQWVDHSELYRRDEKTGLSCAWDEKSFGIVAYGEKDKKNVALLWDAFQKKDVAFYPQVGVFHTGGGLIFCIVSKVPENDVKKMLESDLDYKEMLRQSAATGIEEELKAAGKAWFALSPEWSKKIRSTIDGKIQTEFSVIYWLNPRDQDVNNSGWFTVEQLKLWAQNKGPVKMTLEQQRDRRSGR